MNTILHIGAGEATELSDWLKTGAAQIVLVEPNPELAENLRQKTCDEPRVTVVEAAITSSFECCQLFESNLPEASSLRAPTGLKELFPGLKIIATHSVVPLSPEQLLEEHCVGIAQPAMLVLQTPGEENAIIEALINTDRLRQFDRIQLTANPEAYYEDSVAAEITLQRLIDYGYDITDENKRDPDWVNWYLSRNPMKEKISELQNTIKSQARELEERTSDLAELNQEKAELRQRLEQSSVETKTLRERASVEVAEKDHQAEALQREVEALKAEVTDWKAQCDSLKEKNRELTDAEGELKKAHLALVEAEKTQGILETEAESSQKTLAEYEQQSAQSKRQLGNKQTRIKELESLVSDLTHQRDSMEKKNQLMQQDLVKAETQLQLLKEFVLNE